MTKEHLYELFGSKYDSRNSHKQILDEFFKNNVITPKGSNPLRLAKYIHDLAEGRKVYVKTIKDPYFKDAEFYYEEFKLAQSLSDENSPLKLFSPEEIADMEYRCSFVYANTSMTTDEYFTKEEANKKGFEIIEETGRIRQ
jgi:hypothetical protein